MERMRNDMSCVPPVISTVNSVLIQYHRMVVDCVFLHGHLYILVLKSYRELSLQVIMYSIYFFAFVEVSMDILWM